MSIPELVVPVRFDVGKVPAALKTVGDAGKAAGDSTADGFKRADRAAEGLSDSMMGLMKSHAVLGGLSKVSDAISRTMQDAAEYTKSVASQFINTQKAMQSIAALSGKPNTNQFTLAQVQKALSANLTPEEFTKFQDAFLSKASNYVGSGPNSKMSDEESEKFQASMAEYGKLHGVAPGEMAEFAGSLLAQQKGPTTAEEMTARAGKVFGTLEASSAKVGHLLPGMTRVTAQGLSAEEAAPFLAQMPEIAPEEESTHLLRVLAELRRNNLEGKGADYGLTDDMKPAEQLKTLIGNLHERSAGGTDTKRLDNLIRDFTHEDIAANTLRGLVNQGPAGLDQWRGTLERTPNDLVIRDIARGRQSDAGKAMHAEADLAAAEAESGARYAGVETLKKEAEAQLTRENRFDGSHYFEDSFRNIFALAGAPNWKGQLVNERTLKLAQERAGIPEAERGTFVGVAGNTTTNEVVKGLLERQAKHLEEQTLMMQKDQARPLVVPPPSTSGRMGN